MSRSLLANTRYFQCDYPLCKADEFQCKNGWCLHRTWVCDGNNDCLGEEMIVKNPADTAIQMNSKNCISHSR